MKNTLTTFLRKPAVAFTIGILIPVLGYMLFAPLPEEKMSEVKDEGEEVITPAPTGTAPVEEKVSVEELPSFNTETLAQYDGTDPNLPIYIALEGKVYDVTPGREFYEPGAAYDFLAGTDGSTLLKLVGGDTIKRKYEVVGTFAE